MLYKKGQVFSVYISCLSTSLSVQYYHIPIYDIMFLYDLLNGLISSPELLSHIGLNVQTHILRKSNFFHVSLSKNNYTSTSFFPRALSLANSIMDHVDFFAMSRFVFRQNVFLALNLNSLV